jgi:hypothetical protein
MVVTYDNSDDPPIAIAPLGSDLASCQMWVKAHQEFMMVPSPSGQWTLVYLSDGGTVMLEGASFWHTTEVHEVARLMRIWINNQADRGHL